ncbi:MAG: hypothetical protein ACOC44_03135 [Promethearchaeia archaeon]
MSNYSRKELLDAEATMNQLRNMVTHLQRFMNKSGVEDIPERYRRMGKNMAETYVKYWKPIESVRLANIRDVMTTIYKKIVNSKIDVSINEKERLITVVDSNCSLCKYQFEDILIAGCEIILGLVSELINSINSNPPATSRLRLEPFAVKESRTFGDDSCVQIYKYKIE